jgi:hypothetical protein
MLIEFLGDAKLPIPGTGCRCWPVAPGQPRLLRPENANVMQDTARWDGSPPCALARGSGRCAPSLPSSAHEEWRPRLLVELRAPDADEKNCETNPITPQESWRNWHGEMPSDTAVAARFGQAAPVVWRSCWRALAGCGGAGGMTAQKCVGAPLGSMPCPPPTQARPARSAWSCRPPPGQAAGRWHRFPRSHGPAEHKVKNAMVNASLPCKPGPSAKRIDSGPCPISRVDMPKQPKSRKNPGEFRNH